MTFEKLQHLVLQRSVLYMSFVYTTAGCGVALMSLHLHFFSTSTDAATLVHFVTRHQTSHHLGLAPT